MTKENYDKATTLHKQIENCDKLLKLFDPDEKMPRTQYVSIIEYNKIAPITFLEQNKPLYNKLNNVVEEYMKQLEEQFKNL